MHIAIIQRDGRVVFPGHVIQLRYDITMHRAKALLNCLPTNQPNLAKAAGRLKSARSAH